MQRAAHWLLTMATIPIFALLVACGDIEPGTDTVSTAGGEQNAGSELPCSDCHTLEAALDPLLINDAGSAGKHTTHVETLQFPCESCHADYYWDDLHINGRLDTADAGAAIVRFDENNPDGSWTGDTGPQTGSCANLYCHGGVSQPDWYATETLGCTDCHTSGSAIDPGGGGTAGKHDTHVNGTHAAANGFACEACHEAYTSRATHVNFQPDAGDPAVTIVNFSRPNTAGSWTGDTGPQTGSCANVYCHGGVSQPAWYATETPGCTDCHTSGSALDPEGRPGCTTCHSSGSAINLGGVGGLHELPLLWEHH